MIVVENCALFDGVEEELIENVHVTIEDGEIKEVGHGKARVHADRQIDAGGKTLMPGLIDAHVHVIAGIADLGKLDWLPRSLLGQYARKSLEDMLLRGFTSVRDAGGADYGLARAIEHGLIRGPRLFYSGRALSQTGGHGDTIPYAQDTESLCRCGASRVAISRIADGVPAVLHAARDELRKGATQIKIMASGGVASPSDPIGNLQYSEDEIRAIVGEAKSWGKYVMAHAYTSEAVARAVEFGVRSIEHANLIDEKTAALIASHDAFVVPTLSTYEALAQEGRELGFPEVSLEKLSDVREAGLLAVERLRSAKVKMGYGTDLLGDMQRHQMMEFRLRTEVVPQIDVLRSATSVNGELLQCKGKIGVVREGAYADLLLVDGNPVEDPTIFERPTEKITLIMKGGEVMVER